MMQSRGRARFAVLVPFTNVNLEPDMVLMRPGGVSLHFARLGGYDAEVIPDDAQMQQLGDSDLDEPLRLIMAVKPDVILYGCTSATLTHGPTFDRELAERIKATSGAQTVTAASALVHGLRTLGVRRVGFASPYVSAINDMAVDFLAQSGVETLQRSECGEALGNSEQGALEPQSVYELGVAADHPDVEAIVLSCTDMRSVEVIARLEATLGKPVVSSNQAMMFQSMQLAGVDEGMAGFGQLMERVA